MEQNKNMKSPKLSLLALILININVMLGAGIFINTSILTEITGSMGFLVYAICGILLLPIVLSIIKLWEKTKGASTFYHFGLLISPFFGFLSTWSYFIGKICSFTLGIHVCVSLLQEIFVPIQSISTLFLDSVIILIFTLLNLMNLKLGKKIQYSFLSLKTIPILFAISSGIYLFSFSNFTTNSLLISKIPVGVPLVIYAFAGFEVSCSLSQLIKNPEKNGPKAILISFIITLILVTLFQLMFYVSLGMPLAFLPEGYLDSYPALLNKLSNNLQYYKNFLLGLFYIGIASSSAGSAYGIMYSNSWNLYILAHYKHTFAKSFLTSLNKNYIPYLCVLIEAFLAFIYLFLTQGEQIPLQQGGALGIMIAYTFSVIALLISTQKETKSISVLAIISVFSCLLLMSSFIWSIYSSGISSLLVLLFLILIVGTYMFYKKHEPENLKVYEKL